MPQVGIHASIGLLGSQFGLATLPIEAPLKRAMIFGFVTGNMIPDFDLVASVMMWLIDKEVALSLHRGFTHSLLAVLLLAGGFSMAAAILADRETQFFGIGMSLGVFAHFFADIFAWFSPVEVLWPLGFFGLPSTINLWEGWTTPPLMGRLLAAAEFLSWALYYRWLWILSIRFRTNLDFRPSLVRLEYACWLLWMVYSALAFDLQDRLFLVLHYIPLGVLFMPLCLYVTYRMRETVEGLASPLLAAVWRPAGRATRRSLREE